jgi:hypothetical protein
MSFIERLEKATVATKGLWERPKGVSLAGAWVRNNYAQGLDAPPGTGYLLLPIVSADGSVNRGNLEKAKAKLGPGNSAMRYAP